MGNVAVLFLIAVAVVFMYSKAKKLGELSEKVSKYDV